MKLKGLKFGIFIILVISMLSGCGSNRSSDIKKTESVTDISKDDKDEKLRFNEVSVSFPSVKPHYVDEVETLPDDLKIESTMGSVRDITIKDDYIYYYVNYDSALSAYCKEACIYRQNIAGGSVEKIIDLYLEEGIFVTNLDYDDESLFWTYLKEENTQIVTGDEKPNLYLDRLLNDNVVHCGLVDQSNKYDESDSWKEKIPAEYLDEQSYLIGENDDVTVWNQFEYANDSTKGWYIDCFNKQSGSVSRISANEYGDVVNPLLAGNHIFFLTYRDIKSFTSESDLYDNIYAVNVYTGDVQRVTDNSHGSENSLEATLFFTLEYENGYLFVISADDTVGVDGKVTRNYNKLHYMKIE